MPKVQDEKTKLALKSLIVLIFCTVTLFLLVRFLPSNFVALKVGDQRFYLSIASTVQQQQKGLGYRKSLPYDQGMLFVFSNPSYQCFWMKGMEFPIDIIWLESNKKVILVEPDLSPTSYPNSYCPNMPTKYVIEVNANVAANYGITGGETLQF